MTRVDMRDPHKTYNKLSFVEFKQELSNINWDSYLSGHEIKKINELNLRQPDFFRYLNTIIPASNIVDLKEYMKWHLLLSVSNYLSTDFQNAIFDFYGQTLSGSENFKSDGNVLLQLPTKLWEKPLEKYM